MNDEYDSKIEIELLKKDLATVTSLYEKFDRALDKMQEIAHNLSQMVSLQTQRLENQEKLIRDFSQVMESRRTEHAADLKEVNTRITQTNTSLNDKIDNTERKILLELKEMKLTLEDEIQTDNNSLGGRLREIELWKWLVSGAAALVVWQISTAMDIWDLLKK
jgi:uncharacterized phage infection (PIP) family protein YhgE